MNSATPHIWLAYVPYPVTTAIYLERALRTSCRVTTIGPNFPHELVETWHLQNLRRSFEELNIVTDFTPDMAEYANYPTTDRPDIYLWVESVGGYFPKNLSALGCPTACWLIDTHLNLGWHLQWAQRFDFVFLAQQEYLERFRAAGINAYWLPLACDPEIHAPVDLPKQYDLSFVGSLSHNPRRQQLLKELDKAFGIHCERCWWDDMARVISQSRITFNNAVKNDLNMRVFEALSIGSLLVTDRAPGSGLETLFHDGEDLAIYRSDSELNSVVNLYLANPLLQEQIARRGRQIVHNAHTYTHRAADLLEVCLRDKENTWTAGELRKQSVAGLTAPFDAVCQQQAASCSTSRSFVIPVLDYSPASPYNITSLLQDLADIPGDVIVIFNNPTLADELKGHPRITRSAVMSENIGVARAWNVGISMAVTPYVLILNADLHLQAATVEAIEHGLSTLDRSACVGPQGSFVNYRLAQDFIYFDKGGFGQPMAVDAVSGFLFGVRRELFGPGGLKFEETYTPCYFEEWDLGLQINRLGYKNWIVPTTAYDHRWGGTIGGLRSISCLGRDETSQAILQRNRQYFFYKWRNPATGRLPDSGWRQFGLAYAERLLDQAQLSEADPVVQSLVTEWPDDQEITQVHLSLAFQKGDMRQSAALGKRLAKQLLHADQPSPQPVLLAAQDKEIAEQFGIPADDSRYYSQQQGIVAVDQQRWLAAQEVERRTWFSLFPNFQDDRSAEHRQLFADYQAVPLQCGDVLEIGCGPFTQSRSILNGRSIQSLTLLDPLLAEYLEHPNCSYKGGLFYGQQVNLLSVPAEKLPASLSFDLIICINVLEHVQDARLVLERLLAALRPDGHLILGEYCHDDYHPSDEFNLAHPIMLKKAFLQEMTRGLTIVYLNQDNNLYYLIARQPSDT
jgi:SAM-dependent methyltransferase